MRSAQNRDEIGATTIKKLTPPRCENVATRKHPVIKIQSSSLLVEIIFFSLFVKPSSFILISIDSPNETMPTKTYAKRWTLVCVYNHMCVMCIYIYIYMYLYIDVHRQLKTNTHAKSNMSVQTGEHKHVTSKHVK